MRPNARVMCCIRSLSDRVAPVRKSLVKRPSFAPSTHGSYYRLNTPDEPSEIKSTWAEKVSFCVRPPPASVDLRDRGGGPVWGKLSGSGRRGSRAGFGYESGRSNPTAASVSCFTPQLQRNNPTPAAHYITFTGRWLLQRFLRCICYIIAGFGSYERNPLRSRHEPR